VANCWLSSPSHLISWIPWQADKKIQKIGTKTKKMIKKSVQKTKKEKKNQCKIQKKQK
jgi:hypothetical protein